MKSRNYIKTLRIRLLILIFCSIIVPCCILGIIFFARAQQYILMAISIVGVVIGFYGLPISWQKWSDFHSLKAVFCGISYDNILDLKILAHNVGKNNEKVIKDIRMLLSKRFLIGYLINEDETKLIKLEQDTKFLNGVCSNCGANLGDQKVCPYCGTRYKKNHN